MTGPPTPATPVATWARMPEETPKAWEAFVTYRNLGPGRSIKKAAHLLGKARRTLDSWTSLYRWVQRARDWDAFQDQALLQQTVQQRRDMDGRHRQIARAMCQHVASSLRALAKHPPCKECGCRGSEGPPVEAQDIPKWLETAQRAERIALGLDPAGVRHLHVSGRVTVAPDPVHVLIADSETQALAVALLARVDQLKVEHYRLQEQALPSLEDILDAEEEEAAQRARYDDPPREGEEGEEEAEPLDPPAPPPPFDPDYPKDDP